MKASHKFTNETFLFLAFFESLLSYWLQKLRKRVKSDLYSGEHLAGGRNLPAPPVPLRPADTSSLAFKG